MLQEGQVIFELKKNLDICIAHDLRVIYKKERFYVQQYDEDSDYWSNQADRATAHEAMGDCVTWYFCTPEYAEILKNEEDAHVSGLHHPLSNPDVTDLQDECTMYFNNLVVSGRELDMKDRIYEAAMKAVYGNCVFDWIDDLKNREWVKKSQKILET